MDKKTMKKGFFARLLSFGVFLMSVVVFGAAAVGVSADTYTLKDGAAPFTEGNYKCYVLNDGNSKSVAIGWASNETPTGASLTIPTSISHGGTTYTVKAVAEGGFRNCAFETVSFATQANIREIKAEGFASCQNLTEFIFPQNIDHISPSTFRDCRNLAHIKYRKDNGTETTANSKITSVGDHAFTNCVKLVSFPCPSSLTSIGESAFQSCSRMLTFFFPKTKISNGNITNPITVGKYAFADCTSMTICHFDTNLNDVGEYIFAECEKLVLYYRGDAIPDASDVGTSFHQYWRKKHIATNKNTDNGPEPGGDYVPYELEIGQINTSDAYEGLYWTIEESNTPIMFDQYTTKTDSNYLKLVANPGEKYARIFKFEVPPATPSGPNPYYNVSTGALTIPNKLPDDTDTGRTVKVIASNAFAGNDSIKSVTFNQGLVQICNHAFYNCPNIESLNFAVCDSLKEVSFQVFHDQNSPENTKVTTLRLPKCLQLIGAYAFYNFTAVTDFGFTTTNILYGDFSTSTIPQTVFIGRYAFARLGYRCGTGGTVDLLLSSKLHENECEKWRPSTGDLSKPHDNFENWSSPILPCAFQDANCIRSIRVWNQDLASGTKPRWSMMTNAFCRCKSLVSFRSNKMLAYIGKGCFEGCEKLRELFLYVGGQYTGVSADYVPWGNPGGSGDGGPIFGSDAKYSYPDAVIYINVASSGLHSNNKSYTAGKPYGMNWNADPSGTYIDQFGSPDDGRTLHRSTIPTYYEVAVNDTGKYVTWFGSNATNNGLKYLDLSSNAIIYDGEPDWNHNLVAMVCKNAKYTTTRCYCASNQAEVNLTANDTIRGNIVEIGQSTFAQMPNGGNNNGDNSLTISYTRYLPGTTIYLPATGITKIGERAFFRKDDDQTNSRGVQIVTYKTGDPLSAVEIEDTSAYCVLPSSVVEIGTCAFYNNRFQEINVEGEITSFGMSAFSVLNYRSSNGNTNVSRATVSSITIATNSNFEVTEGGLYYSVTDKRTLLYQPPTGTGTFDLATIDHDKSKTTNAIGPRALANTGYTTITLPSSVTKLYGGAVTRNINLSTFNASGLEYIGTPLASELFSSVSFVWQEHPKSNGLGWEETPQNYDSSFGVFAGCRSLATMDFTQLTSLKKIGYSAFRDCTSLVNMVGTKTYSYFKWNDSQDGLEVYATGSKDISTGVLDLRGSSTLESIGRYAFGNCAAIDFVHLPNYNQLYVGSDKDVGSGLQGDSSPFSGTGNAVVLFGEKAKVAAPQSSTGDHSEARYPNRIFNGIVPYFPAVNESDFIGVATQTTTAYWIKLGDESDRRFLLCNNRAEAKKWFDLASDKKTEYLSAVIGS